jgi:hypothetical protein
MWPRGVGNSLQYEIARIENIVVCELLCNWREKTEKTWNLGGR